MIRVLLLLLSVIPLYQSMDEAIVNLAFVGFQRKHGKRYKDEAEERKRAKIFQSNLEYIEKVNAQNLSYALGVNQYSDLTFEEFAAQMLHPFVVDDNLQERLPVEVGDRVGVPTSVDWRGKGVLNPIKNQGQCGSCWAFSAIGALEAQYAIATKKLLSFSEQQLVDCSTEFGNDGCRGGFMYRGYDYIQKYGIDQESTYPYKAKDDPCQTAVESKADGVPVGEVTGSTNVSFTDAALMAAVAKAPVSVVVNINNDFWSYKSGVFSGGCTGPRFVHGVVVVGYGSKDGDDYYIIRNSWGTAWGQKGYMYAKRGDQCSILNYMCVATLKAR